MLPSQRWIFLSPDAGGYWLREQTGDNLRQWEGHPHRYTSCHRQVSSGDSVDSPACGRQVWRWWQWLPSLWWTAWSWHFSRERSLRASQCHCLVSTCLRRVSQAKMTYPCMDFVNGALICCCVPFIIHISYESVILKLPALYQHLDLVKWPAMHEQEAQDCHTNSEGTRDHLSRLVPRSLNPKP